MYTFTKLNVSAHKYGGRTKSDAKNKED